MHELSVGHELDTAEGRRQILALLLSPQWEQSQLTAA